MVGVGRTFYLNHSGVRGHPESGQDGSYRVDEAVADVHGVGSGRRMRRRAAAAPVPAMLQEGVSAGFRLPVRIRPGDPRVNGPTANSVAA